MGELPRLSLHQRLERRRLRNPYAIDRAVRLQFRLGRGGVGKRCVAVGTETDGSIVSPASYCGVVGPGRRSALSAVGHHLSPPARTPPGVARTVADAAALLGAMAGVDSRDAATEASAGKTAITPLDVKACGAPASAWREISGWHPRGRVMDAALEAMRREGAVLIDPTSLPAARSRRCRTQVMVYEFKPAERLFCCARFRRASESLKELIEFNERNRRECRSSARRF